MENIFIVRNWQKKRFIFWIKSTSYFLKEVWLWWASRLIFFLTWYVVKNNETHPNMQRKIGVTVFVLEIWGLFGDPNIKVFSYYLVEYKSTDFLKTLIALSVQGRYYDIFSRFDHNWKAWIAIFGGRQWLYKTICRGISPVNFFLNRQCIDKQKIKSFAHSKI